MKQSEVITMTVTEAAGVLPAHPSRIRRDIRAGLIPTVPIYGDRKRHHIDAQALADSLEKRGYAQEAARVRAYLQSRAKKEEIG